MAAIAAEMPGVGENPLAYDRESWRMLSDLFDAVAGIAPVREIYAVAMSFSGHLALRCAANDPRLNGIVTVGAPVAEFFEDRAWWSQVPTTTKRTLAHLTGVPVADVHDHLREFALQPSELARIPVPVRYVVSRRDEVIPPGDPRALARHVTDFAWTQFDDVHGSPDHVTRTRLWVLRSVLRMHGRTRFPLAALGLHALKLIAVKGRTWIC
jgi:pimeloyl-ACP methyl ester carboxylesterase